MRLISLILPLLLLATSVMAVESIKFKDTIKKGYAEIDLFKAQQSKNNLTAGELEAFRISHGNKLIFAVDVNESANGTEKASSQGVTIKSAFVRIKRSSGTTDYSTYTTPTTTLVAEEGTTDRAFYYTLLGETGSSRITGNTNADITSEFDGLLTFEVGANISDAISATLIIQLLQTNVSLGDPEAFYDFTGGYEDVAILNTVDAAYLETLEAGVAGSPLVIAQNQINNSVDAWIYYPSSDSYYVVAYEDRFPERGDYDFNDLVIGYRVGFGMKDTQVNSIITTGYMIARGASDNHDWHLHIPFANNISGSATVNLFKPDSVLQEDGYPQVRTVNQRFNLKIFESTKSLMKVNTSDFANTLANQTPIKGHKFSVAFDLDSPVGYDAVPAPPYDPYLYVQSTGYEIHLPGHATQLSYSTNSGSSNTSYKDSSGYPYALVFPDDWVPPLEYVDLGEAYGDFLNYTIYGEEQKSDWYLSPKSSKTKSIGASFWKW